MNQLLFIYSVLVAVISSCAILTEAKTYECVDKQTVRLNDTRGTFSVNRKSSECIFKSSDNSQLFAIRTDNLALNAGEFVEFVEFDPPQVRKSFPPPYNSGWLIYGGAKETDVVFHLKPIANSTSADETILIDFIQGSNEFYLNINDLLLTPSSVKNINLVVQKNTADLVLFEANGVGQKLLKEQTNTIPINFDGDNPVRVKTSLVYPNCSGIFTDQSTTSHDLVGPDLTKVNFNSGFICANLFSNQIASEQAHYDVDFRDFLGLSQSFDELTINNIAYTNSMANGGILSFEGKDLLVLYKSPKPSKPSKIQFKLKVLAKQYGGVVNEPMVLPIPSSIKDIQYVLRSPSPDQYTAITMADKLQLPGLSMLVLSENKLIGNFTNSKDLPAVLAAEKPNADLTLQISGPSLDKLTKSINFNPLAKSCNRLINGNGGLLSASGPGPGTCYWTVNIADNSELRILANDLIPDGCLKITTQYQEKPVYDKCNISSGEILPPFILNKAIMKVTLPSKETSLSAVVSKSLFKNEMEITPANEIAITSQNYPQSYPWSSEQQVYLVDGLQKNYLFSVVDVDIRRGEKLLVDKTELNKDSTRNDIIRLNRTTTFTISRPSNTSDFSPHRGFKIIGKHFDEILESGTDKAQLATSESSTSSLIKISSPGNRLQFSLNTAGNSKSYSLSIYDGSTRQRQQMAVTNLTNLETTSNTLLIVYQSVKSGSKLPKLTVDFKPIACNTTLPLPDGDFSCDKSTRCVPKKMLCQLKNPRQFYCDDGSDVTIPCTSDGPLPPPQPNIIEGGVGGMTVFILCMIMLILGSVGSLYGPDFLKYLDSRFRSGRYTTFSSVE